VPFEKALQAAVVHLFEAKVFYDARDIILNGMIVLG